MSFDASLLFWLRKLPQCRQIQLHQLRYYGNYVLVAIELFGTFLLAILPPITKRDEPITMLIFSMASWVVGAIIILHWMDKESLHPEIALLSEASVVMLNVGFCIYVVVLRGPMVYLILTLLLFLIPSLLLFSYGLYSTRRWDSYASRSNAVIATSQTRPTEGNVSQDINEPEGHLESAFKEQQEEQRFLPFHDSEDEFAAESDALLDRRAISALAAQHENNIDSTIRTKEPYSDLEPEPGASASATSVRTAVAAEFSRSKGKGKAIDTLAPTRVDDDYSEDFMTVAAIGPQKWLQQMQRTRTQWQHTVSQEFDVNKAFELDDLGNVVEVLMQRNYNQSFLRDTASGTARVKPMHFASNLQLLDPLNSNHLWHTCLAILVFNTMAFVSGVYGFAALRSSEDGAMYTQHIVYAIAFPWIDISVLLLLVEKLRRGPTNRDLLKLISAFTAVTLVWAAALAVLTVSIWHFTVPPGSTRTGVVFALVEGTSVGSISSHFLTIVVLVLRLMNRRGL